MEETINYTSTYCYNSLLARALLIGSSLFYIITVYLLCFAARHEYKTTKQDHLK